MNSTCWQKLFSQTLPTIAQIFLFLQIAYYLNLYFAQTVSPTLSVKRIYLSVNICFRIWWTLWNPTELLFENHLSKWKRCWFHRVVWGVFPHTAGLYCQAGEVQPEAWVIEQTPFSPEAGFQRLWELNEPVGYIRDSWYESPLFHNHLGVWFILFEVKGSWIPL